MKNIYLIGITGVGKSTFGQTLANVINFSFHDLDECITQRSQMSIASFFEAHGEKAFREEERNCLLKTEQMDRTVIACGGGIVEREDNREWLKQQEMVIYLQRDIEGIMATLETEHRPLVKDDPSALYALHARREALYEDVCTLKINNESMTDSLKEVITELRGKGIL